MTSLWHVLAATLEQELAAGAAESRALRDRVQQLQNELIRVRPWAPGHSRGTPRLGVLPRIPRGFLLQKNNREKELVLLQRCHRQQQVTLRRCQDRVAKARALGQALRQQEKVSAGSE